MISRDSSLARRARHHHAEAHKKSTMVANKQSVLILIIVALLAIIGVDARPDDMKQSVTASRLTRVASGVRMAADVLCSLTAPAWWYSNEVVTPTNIWSTLLVSLGLEQRRLQQVRCGIGHFALFEEMVV